MAYEAAFSKNDRKVKQEALQKARLLFAKINQFGPSPRDKRIWIFKPKLSRIVA